MNRDKNPFEYEGANNLSEDEILDFYFEDFNFSRFLQSTKNIFLIGERGTGKTMTLLYNSFKVRYKDSKNKNQKTSFDRIGVHIPCNTPLFHKKEHLLLENHFQSYIVCEHYLVLSIIYSISQTLVSIEEILKDSSQIDTELKEDIEYLLDIELHKGSHFFESISKFVSKEIRETQKKINDPLSNEFYSNALSFSSLVIPFLNTIKKIPILANSHFILMIDDAHDLNQYQVRTLNSWIAYRDHSDFSFKVATAKVNKPEFITSTGGTILEGHDFISIDMEKPYQNKDSDFYKMALEIVQKRLNKFNIQKSVEDFFPANPELTKDLELCKAKVIQDARNKYPTGTEKQISDYLYKYQRAEYFRQRATKANLPPYSGFQTIVDISTGVIRNLLDPCYWMYDAELSKDSDKDILNLIPFTIQNTIIQQRSEKMWERLITGLDKEVEGCSPNQAKQIHNLFNNLMGLFKERLLKHKSEPRAIVFTISQKNEELMAHINPLLDIARKAQMLYTRIGNAKDEGKKEIIYVPNRMLMPSRGLDPHGQYSRVSLKAKDIWHAADKDKGFTFGEEEEDQNTTLIQGDLFNDNI